MNIMTKLITRQLRRAVGINLMLSQMQLLESRILSQMQLLESPILSQMQLLESRILSQMQLLESRVLTDSPNVSSMESGLEVLPGTIYSKVAIPLDYHPSREYTPRWGYSHEKIKVLDEWFFTFQDNYKVFIKKMFNENIDSIATDYDSKKPSKPAFIGGAITAFDSLALYTMLSVNKPKVYCEIGSGMTTLFAKQSIQDHKLTTKIISIDPEPRQFVDNICDEIIRKPLERLDPEWFDQLSEGDILFIDGSHRSFMNSDVTVFFIDILPRIKPGVIIHIHDINLPYDYPDWTKEWYWNEQYLLAVYLQASMDMVIPLLPTTYICRDHDMRILIRESFVTLGSSKNDESWFGGGSFWFTKK